MQNDVLSFKDAPVIGNVPVKGGGGFIMRRSQTYFSIDSSSSTRDIADNGGGICGHRCAFSGKIQVPNSQYSGKVLGERGGGIPGVIDCNAYVTYFMRCL